MYRHPFLVPDPPKLSELAEELRAIEQSNRYTNFGPVNARFEDAALQTLFNGRGALTTVANATLGLMLAIEAALPPRNQRRRYAILPSFTFAATADAALWCGLTPLFCDIEADTWNPSIDSIRELCLQYRDDIAVIVACTTFGNPIELSAYEQISDQFGVPVVVDAAAAVGSITNAGQFGIHSRFPVVYSLHATKAFATGEGGLIYSTDAEVIGRIRQMSNFGFDEHRVSTMLGMNAKLTEVAALLCLEKLRGFNEVIEHRTQLYAEYESLLGDLAIQRTTATKRAYQFCPVSIRGSRDERDRLVVELANRGVEARTYFSPALHQMEFFATQSCAGDLRVTESLSDRVISLPIHDKLTASDVATIAALVMDILPEQVHA